MAKPKPVAKKKPVVKKPAKPPAKPAAKKKPAKKKPSKKSTKLEHPLSALPGPSTPGEEEDKEVINRILKKGQFRPKPAKNKSQRKKKKKPAKKKPSKKSTKLEHPLSALP